MTWTKVIENGIRILEFEFMSTWIQGATKV
jgi:hypothetical protein